MDTAVILERTEAFAREALSGEGTGHDWWHIERVRANARHINVTEQGDPFIIELAVLLHDVGDRKVLHQDEDDHTIADRFLQEVGVADAVREEVLFIITNMSFSKSLGSSHANLSKEFCVVQDADRLDASGAIGIARTFAYGGREGHSLYDPEQTAQQFTTTKEYRAHQSSAIHHFEEKIFQLKDLMHTETARSIATTREAFVRTYLDQFFAEWHGRA